MQKRSGNSIIEVMVVIVILTIGLVGAYGILNSGQKLSISTENRIKGDNIAREGIESVQNIRDTNWIRFPSDYKHCWNVKDYDGSCIGAADTDASRLIPAGSYILDFSNGEWKLISKMSSATFDNSYRSSFPVYLDNLGSTTQTTVYTPLCNASNITKNCKTIFTREIQISYPASPLDKKMFVKSIVKWDDGTKTGDNYTIKLESELTNWKEDL